MSLFLLSLRISDQLKVNILQFYVKMCDDVRGASPSHLVFTSQAERRERPP